MSFLFKGLLISSFFLNPVAAVKAESVQSSTQLQIVHVEITSHLGDGQTFVEGDQVTFMLSLDKAAYVYLFYEDAGGHILQLVPNQKQRSNFYQPGMFMLIPDQDAEYKFIVQSPFGEDKLWVFAVDRPVTEFSGQKLDNGLKILEKNIFQVKALIKEHALKLYGCSRLLIKTKAR